jgi:hypothetical protein
MRWAGHVILMERREKYTTTILFGEPQGKIILGNLGVQDMIILNWIFNK